MKYCVPTVVYLNSIFSESDLYTNDNIYISGIDLDIPNIVHIIIDKNPNNSLDLTIDKIE